MNKKQKKMLTRIVVAAVLLVALHFFPASGIVRFVLYMIPYLIIGYDILIKAGKGVRNRQAFDENFLMAVATVGGHRPRADRQRGLQPRPSALCYFTDRRMVPELCRRQKPP